MPNQQPVRLWRNLRLATLRSDLPGLGEISSAAIAVRDGRIVFAGAEAELPRGLAAAETFDCRRRWALPAWVDCHTHLVYGGDRAHEFEMRLAGATYEEIARAGGGIAATVAATRALDAEGLTAASLARLDALLAEGTGTVEIKSGYGLTIASELDMLRAARRLGELRPVRVSTTYLAAHAAPPEYKGRNPDYLAEVALPGMARAAAEGLADMVDGFCEGIAFSPAEIATVFAEARRLGLPVKLHAEQLSDLGGAALAARHGARSAEHLEWLSAEGVAEMAKAGTVAVLLPGAFYTLRETKKPPVRALRDAGVAIAISTDANPGTSPLTSPLLTMNMAATLFGLTVEEAIIGFTRNAARALGLEAETGTLEVGKSADFAIWNIERPAELVYRLGFNPLHARVFKGEMAR